MKKIAMEKLSIKKYQNEKKFWKDIASAIYTELGGAAARRREEREAVGLSVEEVGLAFLGLSGGKTPAPLYQLLREDSKIDWAKTEVFLVDERLVPRDHEKSNSRMIRENLYTGANENYLANFHDFITELPVDETIDQYREEFSLVPEEQLDVVILGVGPDGHFAAVFPGWLEKSKKFYEEGGTAMLTETDVFDVQERITLTAEIIKSSKKILVIMKGVEKQTVLEEISNGSKSAEEFPVKFLLEGYRENVEIFYCE